MTKKSEDDSINYPLMIRKFTLCMLLFFPLVCFAQQTWTLKQCIDTAWNNNLKICQQKNTIKIREISYRQARLNLLPDLNGSIGQSFSYGRSLTAVNTYENTNSKQTSFGLSSNLTLFDLKMKYTIDARKADVLASKSDLNNIKQDIELNVISAYMQVLLNKELLHIANDQLVLTKTKIEQNQALITNGKMAEGQLYELQAESAKEELTKTQDENSLKLSMLDLVQIMGVENFEQIDIVVPHTLIDIGAEIPSAQSVYKSALSHRPEIKSAEYLMQSNQKTLLATKAELYPSLTFGASLGTSYYDLSNIPNDSFCKQFNNNLTTSLGFTLSIPIFNKLDVRSQIKIAQYEVENSKLDIINVKLELRKAIQQAYYNVLAAKKQWEAAMKSEIASREAYRFVNQKFEAGCASIYDLYQAKSNLTQALSEEAQAKYEYAFRLKMLELYK